MDVDECLCVMCSVQTKNAVLLPRPRSAYFIFKPKIDICSALRENQNSVREKEKEKCSALRSLKKSAPKDFVAHS